MRAGGSGRFREGSRRNHCPTTPFPSSHPTQSSSSSVPSSRSLPDHCLAPVSTKRSQVIYMDLSLIPTIDVSDITIIIPISKDSERLNGSFECMLFVSSRAETPLHTGSA